MGHMQSCRALRPAGTSQPCLCEHKLVQPKPLPSLMPAAGFGFPVFGFGIGLSTIFNLMILSIVISVSQG